MSLILGSLQCSICMLANSTGDFNPMSITNYKTGRDSECRIPNYNSYDLGFPEAVGHGVRDCTVDGAQRRKGLPSFSLGLLYHDPGRGKSCGGHKKRRQEKKPTFLKMEREFIYHTILLFKMYSSVVFSVFRYVQPSSLNFRTFLSSQSEA